MIVTVVVFMRVVVVFDDELLFEVVLVSIASITPLFVMSVLRTQVSELES